MQLTQARLKELLSYDPETGIFTRLKNVANVKAGALAGCPDKDGYMQIRVDSKLYKSHRLAWLYMTGEAPPARIDHKDVDPANNKWGNLREATAATNAWNSGIAADNTSGVKNVHRHSKSGKWYVEVSANKERHRQGPFDSPKEAALAAQQARSKLHGEFANHGEAA